MRRIDNPLLRQLERQERLRTIREAAYVAAGILIIGLAMVVLVMVF